MRERRVRERRVTRSGKEKQKERKVSKKGGSRGG